jgi:hypothetical protein
LAVCIVKLNKNAKAAIEEWPLQLCTVCGEAKTAGQVWFLLAESSWEDKLRILQWQDRLANREGIHRACSPAHVQELVTHWMAMGTLDYPFADVGLRAPQPQRKPRLLPIFEEPDTQAVRQLGEISVHRESMTRALEENPESLQIILDELTDTLERETAGALARFESALRTSSGCLRQV